MPDSGLRGAIGDDGAGVAPLRIEALRMAAEQASLPLATGRRVSLGLRRFHTLPTPIPGLVLCASDATLREKLRAHPLVKQLAGSMQARVIQATLRGETITPAATPGHCGRA